ncbi:non-heme iron oxygenase ferredoxin subunit [Marinobacterium lutimaris]|uniref:Naphthalene 1,2-dioxygenase system ferredoxin subunit n=1 Tax=Marinobacterium lutimaris TaxID=568106 RepID=A0A1H6BGS5_9GAMM|nr:non-heme iron oxygenase ferredoxin subunit [Marinobacterium lutimaris]SEG59814.1 naphthalene 1,2-dioxygenase system ferredoxin subunit [Marinobacterium lutimaris]
MSDNWIKVTALDEIPDDDVIGVSVEGRQIALYKYEGEVFATDNVCTHGQALLSDGFLEDGEIECPLHQGRFCIKSGKAMCDPLTEDVRTYDTRVDGEEVLLLIG